MTTPAFRPVAPRAVIRPHGAEYCVPAVPYGAQPGAPVTGDLYASTAAAITAAPKAGLYAAYIEAIRAELAAVGSPYCAWSDADTVERCYSTGAAPTACADVIAARNDAGPCFFTGQPLQGI